MTSAAAIGSHYDLGDDFFGLWLDDEMVYSCAMFADREDLHTAQLRKIDYHIRQSRAHGAHRVLDIGCGWGALLRRLVNGGVQTAVGLTLSQSQAKKIQNDAVPGTSVRAESWRDHVSDVPYDAIISIGAFEHFATSDLMPEQKIAVYRSFFEFCHRNLEHAGRVSLQTIAYERADGRVDPLISARIFRESELPYRSEILQASEGLFELVVSRNDRDDYFRTCRIWARNLASRRAEAMAIVGEETTRDFERYLATAAAAFKVGVLSLLRLTFHRRD